MKQHTTNSISSIAILRLAALGDVCMTIPLIRTLQAGLPNTKLYWIISRSMFSFLEGLSGVDFIIIDKPTSLASYWQCYKQLKPFKFDALLVPQASMRSNLLCPLIKAKVKYGFGSIHSRDCQRFFVNKTVTSKREHLIDSFLRFTEPFGIKEKVLKWDLPISEQDRTFAKDCLSQKPGRWLAVCPSTSKAERNWNVKNYIKVVTDLSQRWQFNVLILNGPSEKERQVAQTIAEGISVPHFNMAGKTSLKQLSALVERADALLAPDTGPLHIAGAVGTPVVGLYAVAPAEKSGPYFSMPYVVNKYAQAVKTFLQKSPETISWHQRVHTAKAMTLISAEEVVSKLNELFTQLAFAKQTE